MGVFISYTQENKEHTAWVNYFATRLRYNGIESILDQWSVGPGASLPQFMETGVRENEYVLMICTPEYKRKFNERIGGAGYEAELITAEILNLTRTRKFIPILRNGE